MEASASAAEHGLEALSKLLIVQYNYCVTWAEQMPDRHLCWESKSSSM